MFNWLRKLFESRDLTRNSVPQSLFLPPVLSGVSVSPQSALTISAAWCATRVISEAVASLPLILYRKRPDGGRERAEEHPLYDLVLSEPNEETTSFVLRETAQSHLLLYGNCYLEIVRDGAARPTAIHLIDPRTVVVSRDEFGLRYKVNQVVLNPSDVLHVPGLGFDGLVGYSPITVARQSLGRMIAMETYQASLMGNGARPLLKFKHPSVLSDNAKANIARSIHDEHGGPSNAGKLIFAEEGSDIDPISFNNTDLQFMEQMGFSVDEVARWFNIPPPYLHSLGRATWSNLEQLAMQFLQCTLRPWLVRIEQEYNRKLLSKEEKRTYFFEHLVDSILRADSQARMDFYTKAISWAILSPNEARARENLNAIEGGDTYMMPVNYQPLVKDTSNGSASDQFNSDPK